jgi:hypothetical protein
MTLRHQLRVDQAFNGDLSDVEFTSASFSADSTRLAVGVEEVSLGQDSAIIWQVQDGSVLQRIDGLETVDNLLLSSDATRLFLYDSYRLYLKAIPAAK